MKGKFIQIKSRLWERMPVILVALILFFCIFFAVPSEFLLVPFMISIFNGKYMTDFSFKDLLKTYARIFVIAAAAFITTLNPYTGIVLNFIIPFLLIFIFSNDFNTKGYMIYTMGFIFMELRPIPLNHVPVRIGVMLFTMAFITLALYIYKWYSKREKMFFRLSKAAYASISKQLRAIGQGNEISEEQKLVQKYISALNRIAYNDLSNNYNQVCYVQALTLSRISYFINEYSKMELLEKQDAAYLEKASTLFSQVSISLNDKDNLNLIQSASSFLSENKIENTVLEHSLGYALHALTCVLDDITDLSRMKKMEKIPVIKTSIQSISLKNPIIRFALRLSATVSVTFAFSYFSGIPFSYYLPMNTLLMMFPLHEETMTRIFNRTLGTVIGVVVAGLMMYIFPQKISHFVIISIMLVLMYYSTPSSRTMTIYATCYGIELVSMLTSPGLIIVIRVVFIVAAAIIAFLATKFLLPTTAKGQFLRNHSILHSITLNFIDNTKSILLGSRDGYKAREAALQANRVINELNDSAVTYVNTADQIIYLQYLEVYSLYFSEAEQISVTLRLNRVEPNDRTKILEYLEYQKQYFDNTSTEFCLTKIDDKYLSALMDKSLQTIIKIQNYKAALYSYKPE